jgi:hypothetical protein
VLAKSMCWQGGRLKQVLLNRRERQNFQPCPDDVTQA